MTQLEKILDIIQDTDKNYAPYYDVIPELINKYNYKKGIEIGVFCGGHSKNILEKTKLEKIIGIDTYKSYEPDMPRMDNQSDWDLLHNKVIERLDENRFKLLRKTSDEAFEELKDESFDWVFIDGLHTYEQVKKDMANYSQLIRKGGVIAMHDYNHSYFPRLTDAINEFVAEHYAQLVICPLHLVYVIKTW